MAVGEHAIVSGAYTTQTITSGTNVPDISNVLDLWAHKWTPVLNRIKWIESSGGLKIEWVNEHLGWYYVVNSATIASAGTSFKITSVNAEVTRANQVKMIQEGTMLFAKKSATQHLFGIVTSAPSSGTITFSILAGTSSALTASSKIYIVGHFVNEGSDPFNDVSRARTLLSNKFAILRKDIKITGSQRNTDMYAVPNDMNHQMTLRLLEMQLERERSVLFSTGQARSSTAASYLYGFYGFLNSVSSDAWVDTSATSLTEDTFNDMVAEVYDNGGEGPLLFAADHAHTRLFTKWDSDRVRTVPDAKMGGHFVTRYLTDVGTEVELVPLRKAPRNLAFLIDLANVGLVPKKNRKLIVEPLAKVGDYDRYQMISEYSLELRGYSRGYHAMWTALT